MVTPHIARAALRTDDHRVLLPAAALSGAAMALLSDLVSRGGWFPAALPLNAVTSMLGIPVIAWVLFTGKRWAHQA
jgi:iron complex transport system permease protein